MKRLLSLILAIILCLGLSACGDKKAGKYDDLIAMLDAGKYEEAISHIKEMQPDGDGTTEGTNSLQGIVIPGVIQGDNQSDDAEAAAMVPLLMGQWDFCSEDNDKLPKKWVFHKDGTCYADDVQLQWKSEGLMNFINDAVKRLRIRIYTGDDTKYTMLLCQRETGELGLTCSAEGNYVIYIGCDYIRPEQYEIVELTLDNWSEYFEWTETFSHETDAFGDISTRYKNFCLTLKQPYLARMSYYGSSKCAVEISYVLNGYGVTINNDGVTFEKGSLADVTGTGYSDTVQRTFGFSSGDDRTWYGTQYAVSRVRQIGQQEFYCGYAENQEIIRIQGTLHLLKAS